MMNLIQLLTGQRAYEGITHSRGEHHRIGDGEGFVMTKIDVTPTMRLYLPRVEARLRGITALWFCRKKGHLHTITRMDK